MDIKIILDNDEKDTLFLLSLADGGLVMLGDCGIFLTYNNSVYKKAIDSLKDKHGEVELTHEGILLEMMRLGYGLDFRDTVGEHSVVLSYDDMLNAFDCVDAKVLLKVYYGCYDSYDAFNLLQYLLYGKLVLK